MEKSPQADGPSSIIITSLGPDDVSVLERVDPDVFDDAVDVERAREFLRDPRHHLVVAIDAGTVVGFASAVHYVHPDKPAPELWINEVGVASSHQRRGLARAILDHLLDHAKRLGCREAWVLTERDNTAAMRLYSASGGVDAGDFVMFNFPLEGAGNRDQG